MDTQQTHERKKWRKMDNAPAGVVYGLGLIGALIYYLQHATNFWQGLLGILKAIVWPAITVYHLYGFLKL